MAGRQLSLFDEEVTSARERRSGSFVDNMRLPVHRWFRYSAGFSAEWVRNLIAERFGTSSINVLDPFAGSGTVLLEAEKSGCSAIGLEAHPFVARVARAKLGWREDFSAMRRLGDSILTTARSAACSELTYPPLIAKCFPEPILQELHALRVAWTAAAAGETNGELCWLALTSILRMCSPVGTAQWQYILPKKTKSRTVSPWRAFEAQIDVMARDMAVMQRNGDGPPASLLLDDARECAGVPNEWCDLIVTSPPYANNYDYADATRLEMCFFGEIAGWGDLQSSVRERLVRACTQHVAKYADEARSALSSDLLVPIAGELGGVYDRLESERDNHGGKKPYHAMVTFYFLDMARVWRALRRVTKPGATVCFVIGDSAPYGIHVPVEKWLGELAIAAGFRGFRFEKLRDRNTKWKNRKHRVPLHEGRLWVEA